MQLHCIYCGATYPVTTIRYAREPPDVQAARLAFEQLHDAQCGPKSIGMTLDLQIPERPTNVSP